MNHLPETEAQRLQDTAESRQDEARLLESLCTMLRSRLDDSYREQLLLTRKPNSLQDEFESVHSHLLSSLFSRTFRYGRGADRIWARLTGRP